MKAPPILRSVLYVPAANARAIDKVRGLGSDGVILDLEDAVAPDAKETARGAALAAVADGGFGYRTLVVRTNGLDTPWGEADLTAAALSKADAVLIPKIRNAADLARIAHVLDRAGAPRTLSVWAMIETCEVMLALREIAAAGGRLACLVLGTNDLVKEMRAAPGPDRHSLLGLLANAVVAARAGGYAVLDGVYNDIGNGEGFAAECRQGLSLGFDGKTLIHPSQIASCNEIFSPSAAEIADARAVRDAFAVPEHAGAGVIKLNGRMVERLHLAIAEDVLAKAALMDARAAAAAREER